MVEIEVDEPTVHIRAPRVNPRQGTAVRCEGMSIGYPDHVVADGINLEIEHGDRAAIVGDNGQGKTTLLRSLVHSLDLLGGTMNGPPNQHFRELGFAGVGGNPRRADFTSPACRSGRVLGPGSGLTRWSVSRDHVRFCLIASIPPLVPQ